MYTVLCSVQFAGFREMKTSGTELRLTLLTRSCLGGLMPFFADIVHRFQALAVDTQEYTLLRYITLFSAGMLDCRSCGIM